MDRDLEVSESWVDDMIHVLWEQDCFYTIVTTEFCVTEQQQQSETEITPIIVET